MLLWSEPEEFHYYWTKPNDVTVKFIGEYLQIPLTRIEMVMRALKIPIFLLKRILKTPPMFAT